MKELQQYINENLEKTIRLNSNDSGTLIGLPYPYTVPCVEGSFQEIYYWDTYFTNRGLILSGRAQLAKNNVDNLLFMLNKFGFVPNGNRTWYLRNSQPPFLSLMVYDIYQVCGNKQWLRNSYNSLCTEYNFWQEKRMTPTGLNCYDCQNNGYESDKKVTDYMCERIGFRPQNKSDSELARGLLASGESGWDLNPRMTYHSFDFAPVDLNSLIYALEKNLSYFAQELGLNSEAEEWNSKASKRRELAIKYLCKSNVFFDYDYTEHQNKILASAACFYPLFTNMASDEEAEATRSLLSKLETEFGVVTCAENDTCGTYQWDYPNGWAPMQLIVVDGLLNYGYKEDALRIAKKFVNLVEKVFLQTGELWEKYNIVNGSIEVAAEYETPTMLGWTFGVYSVLKSYLA